MKKVLLEISQILQENTCAGISFLLVFAAASATCEKVTYLSKISRVFAKFTATSDDELYYEFNERL